MINFDIVTANEADKDGDWGLRVSFNTWELSQIPMFHTLSFTAKNGWTLKAAKVVQMERDDKVLYLPGVASDVSGPLGRVANSARDHYPTKEAMLTAKMEIIEALTEYVKAGGFTQNVTTDSYSL